MNRETLCVILDAFQDNLCIYTRTSNGFDTSLISWNTEVSINIKNWADVVDVRPGWLTCVLIIVGELMQIKYQLVLPLLISLLHVVIILNFSQDRIISNKVG